MTDTFTPTWRTTRPPIEWDWRCDLCNAPANEIHFIPTWNSIEQHVAFSCHKHDPGGRSFALEDWFRNEIRSIWDFNTQAKEWCDGEDDRNRHKEHLHLQHYHERLDAKCREEAHRPD